MNSFNFITFFSNDNMRLCRMVGVFRFVIPCTPALFNLNSLTLFLCLYLFTFMISRHYFFLSFHSLILSTIFGGRPAFLAVRLAFAFSALVIFRRLFLGVGFLLSQTGFFLGFFKSDLLLSASIAYYFLLRYPF